MENELNMNKEDIILSNEIIKMIIEKFTDNEKGVRNLKRCLEIIYSKINLYKYIKPETKLFGEDDTRYTFPYTITDEIVNKVIIKKDTRSYLKCIFK